MLTCIIVEDEQHAINLLKSHITKIPFLEVAATFNNPIEALTYLMDHRVDVAFVDIQMPQMSGIELIKLLKGKTNIVITTAYREFAFEGFEEDVSSFLLKPISFEKLLKASEKIYRAKPDIPVHQSTVITKIEQDDDFVVLKTENKNKLIKVDISDIIYIEGLKNYISVFTTQQRIICLLNIKAMEEHLPADKFIRTHKSYLVSKSKIQSLDGNQILLKNVKETIPLSTTYRDDLLQLLRNKIIVNKKSS